MFFMTIVREGPKHASFVYEAAWRLSYVLTVVRVWLDNFYLAVTVLHTGIILVSEHVLPHRTQTSLYHQLVTHPHQLRAR